MPRTFWCFGTAVSALAVALPCRSYADGLSALSVLVIPATLFTTLFLLVLQGVFTAVLRNSRSAVGRALGAVVAAGSLVWNLLALIAILPESPDRDSTTGLYFWFGTDLLVLASSFCTGIYMLSLLGRTPSQ